LIFATDTPYLRDYAPQRKGRRDGQCDT